MRTLRGLALAAWGSALLVGVVAAAPPAAAPQTLFDPHRVISPPLRPVRAPKPERVALPNGAVVFLLEDHTFPVVSGTAYFPSGPALVPAGQTGLDELTGDAMRRGGTASHSGPMLDERLAAIGASITTSLSGDLGYGGFRCQREDLDEVLGLFADLLRNPGFPDDKLKLAKLSLQQAIASRDDEVFSIVSRLSLEAVYGKHSLWGRSPESATVDAVDRAACLRLHDAIFVPERMVLSIYGDFDAAALKRQVAARFADWPRSGTPRPPQPAVTDSTRARLLFANKEDVTQSGLLLAELGHRADEPDDAAMDVVIQALGGGGQSRLNRVIRTERGLAYSTGAAAGEGYLRPGALTAWSLTRNDSALTALGLLRGALADIVHAPLAPEEFAAAKQSVQNQFVFNFEQRSAALFRAAWYEVLGYPADYLDVYQRQLAAVTNESAFAAARRWIHPERMTVIVVGNEKQFERPIESAGLPVERVKLGTAAPPEKN